MTEFRMPTVYVRATVETPFGKGQLMVPVSRVTWEHDLFVPPPPHNPYLALSSEAYQERHRADVKRSEEATQRLREGVIRREAERIMLQDMKVTWWEDEW